MLIVLVSGGSMVDEDDCRHEVWGRRKRGIGLDMMGLEEYNRLMLMLCQSNLEHFY